jgi:hypothetical protein
VLTWPGTPGPNHSKNVDDWGLRRFLLRHRSCSTADASVVSKCPIANSLNLRWVLLKTTVAAREGRGRSTLGTKCLAASKLESFHAFEVRASCWWMVARTVAADANVL